MPEDPLGRLAMLTRCPACATHFRVTAEQLKARSGRVRCGECQQAFNALDALIEEPMALLAMKAARSAQRPPPYDGAGQVADASQAEVPETTEPPPLIPAETAEPMAEVPEAGSALALGEQEPLTPGSDGAAEPEVAEPGPTEPEATEPEATQPEPTAPEATAPEATAPEAVEPVAAQPEAMLAQAARPAAATEDNAGQAEPLPEAPPRRWPWVLACLVALTALCLQAVLAFRVELAVLWPEAKPALVALCEVADCEVGLPAKVALVGIEASDLHPDSEHPGRLVLTATLKSRAPFAQQFPHLELTLTDTADKAIARKVLAPAEYLPPQAALAEGMPPNADIIVTFGVDSGDVKASGYRLYVFYP